MIREIIQITVDNFMFEDNDVEFYADPSGDEIAANTKVIKGIAKELASKYNV